MSVVFKVENIKKEYFNYLLNFRYSIKLNKPLLTIRVMQDYLKLLLFKKVSLRYVDIALDYACNLSCSHCSAKSLERNGICRRMEIKDYINLAKQCYELGVITVGFTGGEPLIYPYLEEAINAFKPEQTMISIKTNAVLLNDEWLRKLKSWKVDSISISLGPVPNDMKDYDRIRGLPLTFEKLLDVAKKAKEYGLRVIVGVVVSHENVHSENIIRVLEITKKMGLILIFGLAVPAGRWSGNKKILLTEDDRTQIYKLLQKYRHTRTDFESNFMTRGCGAINEKLYITPYGDVMPCPFLQVKFGNVLEEPLSKIRNRGLSYSIFNGYPERCLAADHYGFINDCVSLTFGNERLPIDHSRVKKMKDYNELGNKIN